MASSPTTTDALARPLRLLFLAALGLLGATGSAHAHDLGTSIVRLRAVESDGTTKIGSGVVIAEGRVATACHVTRRATSVEILHGSKRWIAAGQIGSPLHDLCVLNVPAADVPFARIRGSHELRRGELVIAAGFQDGGSQLVVRRGTVGELYPYDGAPVIRTNAAFDFGSSGGALFDESGNLVGILAFKARTGESLRFALPTEWLSMPNAVATAFSPIEPDSTAIAFWERPREARPAFLGVAMREAASEHK